MVKLTFLNADTSIEGDTADDVLWLWHRFSGWGNLTMDEFIGRVADQAGMEIDDPEQMDGQDFLYALSAKYPEAWKVEELSSAPPQPTDNLRDAGIHMIDPLKEAPSVE